MDRSAIDEAAHLLIEARRLRRPITALPAASKPRNIEEAHAIQDAAITLSGEAVTGWKVASGLNGQVMRGAILRSRMLTSPACLAAADMRLLGVEAEIAFRFDRTMPPRQELYGAEEVARSVTALAGIEVVDTRFASYRDTPLLDRAADFMSNGAFVAGTVRSDWRDLDLATLRTTLSVNGAVEVETIGGHPARDPILPAIALVNQLRLECGIDEGLIVTTGTYTGLYFARAGDAIAVQFEGFGDVELRFDA